MATSQRGYYDILGVSRNATADDIKKAFRRRAREIHPDLHTGTKKTEKCDTIITFSLFSLRRYARRYCTNIPWHAFVFGHS